LLSITSFEWEALFGGIVFNSSPRHAAIESRNCFCPILPLLYSALFDTDPGLPDCLISNQKSKFGSILDGLDWKNVDIFMAIWIF
jgi:hypothetical protein